MSLDIAKKIEEIRKQPQHIRIKYAWMSVAICMGFIFIIWVFSIITMFQGKDTGNSSSNSMSDLQEKIGNLPKNSISEIDNAIVPDNQNSEGLNYTDPQDNSSISSIENQDQ